jgi:ribosomal protein L44E
MKLKETASKAANKLLKRQQMNFFCFVCNKDITIYQTNKAGQLEPQTICIHMAYKGIE